MGFVPTVLQSAPPCAVLDMYSADGLPLAEPAAAAGLVLPVLCLTLGKIWETSHGKCTFYIINMYTFWHMQYLYLCEDDICIHVFT